MVFNTWTTESSSCYIAMCCNCHLRAQCSCPHLKLEGAALLSEWFMQAHFLFCLKHWESSAGLGVLSLIMHKEECEVSWMTLCEPRTLGSHHPLLGHGLPTRNRAAASEEAFCTVKCTGVTLKIYLYAGSEDTRNHSICSHEVDVKMALWTRAKPT